MKSKLALPAIGAVVAAIALTGCGGATSGSLGKPGQPVHLVVGYQPYYTEGWSAIVLKQTQLWKKFLPKGSTVQFQVGLQGSLIVGQMLAGKEQIGYLGDMPAIVGVSKRSIRDLRIVATAGTSVDQCGVFLVRKSAPQFSSQTQAFNWISGKTVAAAQGSCADRVAQDVFQQDGVKPKAYLNQSQDLIASDFRGGSIDAASVWEPAASKLVDAGLARRVGSGAANGLSDAAFLSMSEQLLKQRPDVAKDWLEAELASQKYLSDPANAAAVTNAAVSQTTGYSAQQMHDSLYKAWPSLLGGAGDRVKLALPFTIDAPTNSLINSATAFLHKIHAIASPQLPPGAVDGALAQQVLQADGGTDPAPVKGQ